MARAPHPSKGRARPATRVYTESERHAALELAATAGRRAASRQLGVSTATIQKWIEKYPALWSDLRAANPDVQKRGFARRLEDLAEDYLVNEHDAIARAAKLLPEADAKETAALMKAMGSARMAATTGSRQVLPEAEIHEHNINFPALEAAIERLLDSATPQQTLPPKRVENQD